VTPARLQGLHLKKLSFTDSVSSPAGPGVPYEVCSLAPLLAGTIGRLHHRQPVGDPALSA